MLAGEDGTVTAGALRLSVTVPGSSLSFREAEMDAAQRLRQELAAMAHNDPAATEKLREAVCAFVDEMKSEGKPAEAVIIAAKQVAATTGLLPMPEQDVLLRSPHADRVITDVVRWCIERYYDRPPRASLPAPPPS
jgi:tellurite resistance protein